MVAVTAGCSAPLLVRRDDATFVAAQERLARTEQVIEELRPPAADRQLFLQAEAFYRYRYAPVPRGLLSNLAQAGAAVIELPVLQALAGALDLMELRLKTYDGAVHLWETLLEQRPQTPLRALTLYRLGWAYRSAGVAGLPRESGDDAFAQLEREAPGTPLAALAGEARQVPWKSKGTATTLSLIPGAGQFYVGEYGNGLTRLAIGLAATALVVVPAVVAYHRRDDLTWSRDWPLLAAGIGGVILLSIDITAAYQDAMRGVVQWNERMEAAFQASHPGAP